MGGGRNKGSYWERVLQVSGWYLSDDAGQNPTFVRRCPVYPAKEVTLVRQITQGSSQIPRSSDLKLFFLTLTSALVQDYGF